MHNMFPRRRSSLIAIIVILLSVQALQGLLFSIFRLADLLAPGRPLIMSGAAIYNGPVADVALMLALASHLITWGLWMLKPWAHHRVVLL